MTEEEKNRLKRKNAPLTYEEWLGFFFVPQQKSNTLFPSDDFNDTEIERFKKFGFDKKLKQAYRAQFLGTIFYILVILISIILIKL
ncbi:hypothetical protein [Tenacibaculum agarivorans]|uniref:hypothetical protein n=1 Tax=Tenacibaculum agarivorans TaxID=1908389 RepID=UPI00094BB95F|nr:hypothetical protein [Tenacibaculum agarivorans]